MVAILSGNGDLSGGRWVPEDDATGTAEFEVHHAQTILRDIHILRPCKCMLPDTPQHSGPVICAQIAPLVNFHAIVRACSRGGRAAGPARAVEFQLQACPDSVHVRRDLNALR